MSSTSSGSSPPLVLDTGAWQLRIGQSTKDVNVGPNQLGTLKAASHQLFKWESLQSLLNAEIGEQLLQLYFPKHLDRWNLFPARSLVSKKIRKKLKTLSLSLRLQSEVWRHAIRLWMKNKLMLAQPQRQVKTDTISAHKNVLQGGVVLTVPVCSGEFFRKSATRSSSTVATRSAKSMTRKGKPAASASSNTDSCKTTSASFGRLFRKCRSINYAGIQKLANIFRAKQPPNMKATASENAAPSAGHDATKNNARTNKTTSTITTGGRGGAGVRKQGGKMKNPPNGNSKTKSATKAGASNSVMTLIVLFIQNSCVLCASHHDLYVFP